MRILLFGQYVPVSISALAVIDTAIFFGALVLAVMVRFHTMQPDLVEPIGDTVWDRAALFAGVSLTSFVALGLYSSRQRARPGGIVVRLVAGVAAASVATASLYYLIPTLAMTLAIGRGLLALSSLFTLLGTMLARAIIFTVVDESVFKHRVLIYGVGECASTIARLRRRTDRRCFDPVGFVQPEGERCAALIPRVLDPGPGLLKLCQRLAVSEIVVAMDDRRCGFPMLELLQCRFCGVDVTDLSTFLERETGRVRLDVLNPSSIIFGEGFHRDPLRMFSVRALDLIASVIMLAWSLPLMVATAIAIKLEDGWHAPVIYRQTRVGLAGRPFNVLKFRSMYANAEPDGRAQWALKEDPRVTRVGAVIRHLRIDELPQIFNVLLGHMSLVGPRPERPEFVTDLARKIPYYRQRHCVKPGITGWAQLCYPYGSSEQDALQKLQYDLFYIKNNSLLFELSILMQTAEVVLFGKGAR
jgi:sugar transferase (PEP-CTERM system associated)